MEISKNAFVIIEYTVRLEDGSYAKGGENGPISLNFIAGYDQVMPSLEQRLLGLDEGSETEFVIPAGEAFGEPDQKLLKKTAIADFPEGQNLSAGKWVVARNPETNAQYTYRVAEKDEDSIILDFNHPLAGKDLHYRVRVVRVRPASKDELEYLRPCEQGESNEPDAQ